MAEADNSADDTVGFAIPYFAISQMRNEQQQNNECQDASADRAQGMQQTGIQIKRIFYGHTAFPEIDRSAGRLNKRRNINTALIRIVPDE
ncbi:hypothetical protein NGC37_08195 [Pantoea anthophila]|uniref:hypothetical protein n=1 Tax=Pantoea TaxID=53335 RepID=UPI002102AAC6|nr:MULTISPECIES: hypothetical protein [Pantoea]MEB7538295.1 hypothetical protein [Pantoea anthophila]